jgi:hypothetical protein
MCSKQKKNNKINITVFNYEAEFRTNQNWHHNHSTLIKISTPREKSFI